MNKQSALFPSGHSAPVLRHPRPRLADVQCSRLKFEPGDRLMVRVQHLLTNDEKKKLHRTIQKWAGSDVEILIVELPFMDIEVEKQKLIVGD